VLVLSGELPLMHEKNNHLVTAKDISRKYKVPYPTINHYTDLGFLAIIKREGNKRMYNDKQVRNRLSLISKMMNEGYPLRLIRKKIGAGEGGF
jgi:DNA-binding transcriptional MerR regulator